MNSKIKTFEIQNLQQYLDAIKQIEETISFKKLWFRGIADESYGLEPSLYRKSNDISIEKQLLNRFKTRALPFIEHKGEKVIGSGYLLCSIMVFLHVCWIGLNQHY